MTNNAIALLSGLFVTGLAAGSVAYYVNEDTDGKKSNKDTCTDTLNSMDKTLKFIITAAAAITAVYGVTNNILKEFEESASSDNAYFFREF